MEKKDLAYSIVNLKPQIAVLTNILSRRCYV